MEEEKISKGKEYEYLTDGLALRKRELEDLIKERMIETRIYFEEQDEKLAKLHQDKRNVEALHQKLIKEWRVWLSK